MLHIYGRGLSVVINANSMWCGRCEVRSFVGWSICGWMLCWRYGSNNFACFFFGSLVELFGESVKDLCDWLQVGVDIFASNKEVLGVETV